MANLAIKGHPTRGHEVIKILEMLGGNNLFHYVGDEVSKCYYIGNDEYVGKVIALKKEPTDSIVFTLEEFLEKYPYKFGDKVTLTNYKGLWEIVDVLWSGKYGFLYYGINNGEKKEFVCVDVLQPYKEETMEKEISGAIVDRFICLEGYDFYDDKGNIIDTKEITMKKKKPKYPKTYDECCKVMNINTHNELCIESPEDYIDDYENKLFDKVNALHKLLICRDAYWKIAGEQMGLDKPWKPYWTIYEHKFCLGTDKDKVIKECVTTGNRILSFPTKKMRDSFYENFKELIEECKEFL